MINVIRRKQQGSVHLPWTFGSQVQGEQDPGRETADDNHVTAFL